MKKTKLLTLPLVVLAMSLFSCRNTDISSNPDVSEYSRSTHTHTYDADWSSDETNHWHNATCGDIARVEEGTHEFGEWEVVQEATETSKGSAKRACVVCGYEETKEINESEHVHEIKYVKKVKATCTTDGVKAHYECTTCGKLFKDEDGEEETTLKSLRIVGRHDLTHHDAKDATHEHDGNIEYWSCSNCDKYFSDGDAKNEITDKSITTIKYYSKGLAYTLCDEGTDSAYYAVSGYGDCEDSDIVIPSTYNNLPVTKIENAAFSQSKKITSVVMPDTITHVGIYAFLNCTNLTKVVFSNNLEEINNSAFCNCDGLTYIVLPSTVTKIVSRAFESCDGLKNVYFKGKSDEWKNVSVGDYNFNGADIYYYSETSQNSCDYWHYDNDGNIQLWKDHTYAQTWSYNDSKHWHVTSCGHNGTSGEAVHTIVNGKCSVCGYVEGTEGIKYTKSTDGKSYIVIGVEDTVSGNIIIPSTYEGLPVTAIGDEAFMANTEITGVKIPEGVTSIGASAFLQCTSLKSINIPEGVTSLSNNVFQNCISLESVTLPNTLTSLTERVFKGCGSLKNITIPESVTTFDEYVFSSAGLEEIVIPSNLTYLGNGVFAGCSNLTKIIIPSNIIEIKDYAFESCYNLTSVEILGANTIGSDVFRLCNKLESIILPTNVTTIGTNAFDQCSSLSSVYFKGLPSEWEITINTNNDLFEKANRYYYTVEQPTDTTYKYWHYNSNNEIEVWHVHTITPVVEKAPTCTEVGYKAHYKCTECGELFIDASGTTKTTLDELKISATGHTYSEDWTYDDNSHWHASTCGHDLKKDVVAHNLVDGKCTICDFGSATKGIKYELSTDGSYAIVTGVEDGVVLSGKVVIASTFGNKPVTTIGQNAFCSYEDNNPFSEITSVILPSSITSIETSAFNNCTNLKSIEIPDGILNISNCFNDTLIVYNEYNDGYYLGNSKNPYLVLIKIKDECTSLTTHKNCKLVADISDHPNLTNLVLNDGFEILCNYSFVSCKIVTIVIPKSLTTVGRVSFDYTSDYQKTVYYKGSPEDWAKISFAADTENLTGATRYYYSNTRPTDTEYTYWYYDSNNDIQIWHVHTISSVIEKAPTCTTEGYKAHYKCTKCDELFADASGTQQTTLDELKIKPTGHTYDTTKWVSDATYHWHACSKEDAKSDQAKHSFVNGKCSICDYELTPTKGITYKLSEDNDYAIVTGVENTRDLPDDIVIAATYNNVPVTQIGDNAFDGCTSLTTVIIPDSITSIGKNAFRGCICLESINIPTSIMSVGQDAFESANDKLYKEENNAIYVGNSDNPYIVLIGINDSTSKITLNSNCKVIANKVFNSNESLTSIALNDGLKYIGDYAFYNCSNLTTIIMPDSVSSIGEYAFESVNSLKAYYKGNANSWNDINIAYGNNNLKYATRYYYSDTSIENGWYYNQDNEPTLW